ENCWIKANPNLDITVSRKDMHRMCKKAIESPSAQNNFLVKKLNIWTTQKVKWINLTKWDACKERIDEVDLVGKLCYGGIDLSSNTDITANVMVFPMESGRFAVVPRFWIPAENARERENRDGVPYTSWAKAGYIKMTEGNVIDYDIVMADIMADCEKFGIDSIAFDRWQFEAIRQRLVNEGVPEDKMISFGQGFASMSAPMNELEKLYLSEKLIHNDNPVLNWMASNVAARMDPAGNIKPDKEKSTEKIDGIVSLIMALGLAITTGPKKPSIYEDRGIISI
ncbi:terminase, partial [Candidatus Pacearchaeota archaeon]|nr:terminase [Candidatus Pacearchaeota archaeon]